MRGIVLAGTHSGCGKTTVSLALMAALVQRGLAVQAFKVGPDYIDPGHHARITGRPSWNLDGWMCGHGGVTAGFHRALCGSLGNAHHTSPPQHAQPPATPPDIVIVEGVMGLYDGASATTNAGSTAEIAAWLGLPVLLVADVKGMARSAVALVRGYRDLAPHLTFAGVVCNRVGGPGHREMLAEAFQHSCPDIPLLGMLPRNDTLTMPSRHLGLVLAHEADTADNGTQLAAWIEDALDITALLDALPQLPHPLQSAATPHTRPHAQPDAQPPAPASTGPASQPDAQVPAQPAAIEVAAPVRIGIASDEAFTFIYPENMALLHEAGAQLVPFSPLRDATLPPALGGLILPGGYPELHAAHLAANTPMHMAIRAFAADLHPVHGECGGFMYLMHTLHTAEGSFAMCGCLPLAARMASQRAALGYREVTLAADCALGTQGTTLRGHEYHYSHLVEAAPAARALWHSADRKGRALGPEGLLLGSVSGTYVHTHFASNPNVARAFVAACARGNPHAQHA